MNVVMLILFFLITFFIGLIYRSTGKKEDFLQTKSRYSTQIMVATIFATSVGGGSIIGVAEKFQEYGMLFSLILSGNFLTQLLVSIFIVPKMHRFIGYVSVGDIIEKPFGKRAKLLTGFFVSLVSVGFVAAQFYSAGIIFHYFLGMPVIMGTLITALAVCFYTMVGGLRSVILTDVFQFAIIMITIPLMLKLGVHHVGGLEEFTKHIHASGWASYNRESITYIDLVLSYSLVGFNPSFIQRVLISKDGKQASLASVLSTLLTIPFFAIIGLITMLDSGGAIGDSDSGFVIFQLMDVFLPDTIKGIVVIGILSAIMSTADSDLNVAATTTYKDIVKYRRKPINDVLTIRLCTVFYSLVAVFISLNFDNVLDIVVFTTSFWAPTVLFPLISVIFSMGLGKSYFYYSVFIGSLVTIVFMNINVGGFVLSGQVMGAIASLVFLIYCFIRKRRRNAVKVY
jgi:solute:Na+ symporter, SSS family